MMMFATRHPPSSPVLGRTFAQHVMKSLERSGERLELLRRQTHQLEATCAHLIHQIIGAARPVAVAGVPKRDERQVLAMESQRVVEHPKVGALPYSVALSAAQPFWQFFALGEDAWCQAC